MNDYRISLRFFVYHSKSVTDFLRTFSKSVTVEHIEHFGFLPCFFYFTNINKITTDKTPKLLDPPPLSRAD